MPARQSLNGGKWPGGREGWQLELAMRAGIEDRQSGLAVGGVGD